ncbi:Membrane protein, putative [Shewanella piezotolerans WP3]|uniref:Membrane protein, putative n=1 Tax=Shewanella piezotolerans (strain WP3 / JCM 13877) TaxID=225849 RepID=B8CSQ0_SHEPW|nr:DUF2975 domain-containing protein [Shewanella piezotolerans]ACJ30676.1 Membrane protein, putative [Shewanella piezotolerans WP3]
MNRIKTLSLLVKFGLYFTLLSMLLSLGVGVWHQDHHVVLGAEGAMKAWLGLEVTGNWEPLAEQLAQSGFNEVLLLGVMQLVPLLLINWILLRLFSLYQQGKVFELANINCFRYLGWTMVGQFVLNIIYPPLLTLSMNELYADLVLTRSITFGENDIAMLLVGFIIIVIAEVMRQGLILQSEQELTI